MSALPQRLDIDFRIHWQGPWHVGSGFGSAAVDRLIQSRACKVKDGAMSRTVQVPFVPGSQLKGVLRHHCERLAATLGCAVVSPHMRGSQVDGELLNGFRPLTRSPFLIDRLFGSRYQGDCLFVNDAVLETPGRGPPREQRGRTSIDRISGTARQATLFVTEVTSGSESQLKGAIHARHPARVLTVDGDGFPLEYALLVAGLLDIDALGGNRSAGLGRCCVEIAAPVRWNRKHLTPVEALTCFQEEEWAAWLNLLREG